MERGRGLKCHNVSNGTVLFWELLVVGGMCLCDANGNNNNDNDDTNKIRLHGIMLEFTPCCSAFRDWRVHISILIWRSKHCEKFLHVVVEGKKMKRWETFARFSTANASRPSFSQAFLFLTSCEEVADRRQWLSWKLTVLWKKAHKAFDLSF